MIHFNDHARAEVGAGNPGLDTLAFHRRLPGYVSTPLRDLAALAAESGLGDLWLKDEADRFGLPAFKILGASWATWRALRDRFGDRLDGWRDLEELARRLEPLKPLELVAATAGNHGRAVARMARWLRLDARIFVPGHAVEQRVAAIRDEGATVVRVDGDYDRAVEQAEGLQGTGVLQIQDTSFPENEQIASWVIEGYSSLGREIDAALDETGMPPPDVVLVQMGVGSLASAVVRHFKQPGRAPVPRIVGVEPEDSACVLESLRQGRVAPVAGSHDSMMAGLACGLMASVSWPWLEPGLDAVVTVRDAGAAEAMRKLASLGIVSGESGAAGLAGLLEVLKAPETTRARLGLGSSARVLLFNTEGATDPGNYRAIVDPTRP